MPGSRVVAPSLRRLGELDRALERGLARAALPAVGFSILVFLLPYIAGAVDRSLAGVGLAVAALSLVLSLLEPKSSRRVFISIFAVALAAHVSIPALLAHFESPAGDIYLGPDGSGYWRGAQSLVNSGLWSGDHPAARFGTYDAAHYYVFAATLLGFGGGLASLQLLNVAMTALAGPIAFAFARRVLPGHAVLIGLLVGLHPSLIALSSADLLKDPLIAVATLAAFWAIAGLLDQGPVRSKMAFALLGVTALIYLRTDRFYVAAMLEAAVAVSLVIRLLRGGLLSLDGVRRPLQLSRVVALALLVLVLAGGELAPTIFGWPFSPAMVIGNAKVVQDTAALHEYAPGVLNVQTPLPQVVAFLANVIRRVFGPFVWVPPSELRLASLEAADFLLYPSTLVWYAILPFTIVGLLATLWRSLRGHTVHLAATALALFVMFDAGVYMTVNLSYRQREAVMPILLIFAILGIAVAAARHWRPRFYVGYLFCLAAIAAVDIVAHHLLT